MRVTVTGYSLEDRKPLSLSTAEAGNCTPRYRQPAVASRLSVAGGLQNPMQKDWEHYKLNKNNKPIVQPMHVRMGDTVKVISGNDKGKVGTVKKVSPHVPDPATTGLHQISHTQQGRVTCLPCKSDCLCHAVVAKDGQGDRGGRQHWGK